MFNPRHVLNQMCTTKSIKGTDRLSLYRDSSLNRRQSIMLHAAKLMVGAPRARKGTQRTEGVYPVERATMRTNDQSRKVPEPLVVLTRVKGHQIRALLDAGAMADFLD